MSVAATLDPRIPAAWASALTPLDGKKPKLPGWQKLPPATATDIERWYSQGNLGMRTGALSGVFVIDVDQQKGGSVPEGLPETVTVETGAGGLHLYFRFPGGLGNSAGKLGDHVDTRGEGGQVVFPGSVHPDTDREYCWKAGHAPWESNLAELPKWALRKLAAPAPIETKGAPMGGIPEGRRDSELYKLACSLRSRNFDRDMAVSAVRHAAEQCNPPYTERPAEAIVAGAYKHPAPAEPLQAIDLLSRVQSVATLQSMTFAPIRWVIPGILPEGLCIFGGRPKAGKSRFILGGAVAVSAGGYAFGSVLCEQGDVLLLALEDNRRRIRERVEQLMGLEPFPSRLDYVAAGEWLPLPSGGLDGIKRWLDAHPEARLVVIDTLGCVRPAGSGGGNQDAYLRDGELLRPLLVLAGERHIAIALLTHTKKMILTDTDWAEAILGSQAQAGTADMILMLERPRGKKHGAILRGRGRDLDQDFALSLTADNVLGGWRLLGPLDDQEGTDEQDAVLDALGQAGGPISPAALANVLGLERNTTKNRLWRMSKAGLVLVDRKGRYSLREKEDSLSTLSSVTTVTSNQRDQCDRRDQSAGASGHSGHTVTRARQSEFEGWL